MAKAESNDVKVEITDIDGEKITLMNIKKAEVNMFTNDEQTLDLDRDTKLVVQVKFEGKFTYDAGLEKTETKKIVQWNTETKVDKMYREVYIVFCKSGTIIRTYRIPEMFITSYSEGYYSDGVEYKLNLLQKDGYYDEITITDI